MGIFYEIFRGAAARHVSEPTQRLVPKTPQQAVASFLLLAGWICAAGLVLSGLVWLVSGAGAVSALPVIGGAVLMFVLARFGSGTRS
ncbi:MAG: hypothetical protein HY827_03325 [Actinobacteria bacterium]|nr:hypothetical protein [Actinomycetota bacterium]